MGADVSKEQKRALKSQVNAKIHTIQIVTVVINLSVLAYVKYLDFFLGNNGDIYKYGVDEKGMGVVIFGILVLLVVGILRERGMKIRETIAKQGFILRWALFLLLLAVVLVFGIYGPSYDASTFIYGQF